MTLETISFWQNISVSIFKFSPFLYAIKACQRNLINFSKYANCLIRKRKSSQWAKENEHGEGMMLIWTFFLKVINDKRKKLTHHEIIDHVAEQTGSMIIQVSKESKLRIHPNLQRPRFSFAYSFKFTYKCFLGLASIIVMNDTNWVKNHCKSLKAIHF